MIQIPDCDIADVDRLDRAGFPKKGTTEVMEVLRKI
jgi:hypothetical protein